MTLTRAAIFAALILCTLAARGLAADVTLTSRDGSIEISGDLLSYDGEFYRVDTIYGVLTVDGSGVICAGPGCPDIEAFVAHFTISGSRTMGEVLMPALVEAFAARNGYAIARQVVDDTHFSYALSEPGSGRLAAQIRFRVTSTPEGFADLLANEADLVLSIRPASGMERELARDAGLGDLGQPRRSRIVALDGMVPIVAPENPAANLSIETLAEIYSGRIANWSELGGEDAPIALHLRDDLSGLAQEFLARVLGGAAPPVTAIRHDSDAALADAVARDTLAIGIAPFSETGNARALAITGRCGMTLVASETSLKAEDYPLTAPLFIYTPARRLPVLAREFLAYVRSPAAQPVVDRAGFVDLRLRRVPLANQGERLANAIRTVGPEVPVDELKRMVRRMAGTARLSLSFRFEIGGTDLDAQSLSNVEILAQHFEAGGLDGERVVFVGFSDGEGPAETNLALARRRAVAVRDAVLKAAATADKSRLKVSVDAFGEAMPMACDDTEWGRQVNRRVEVWVK